ncbi:winged helix-turn-helix transcriptional regulator [Clostridium sp. NSJ-49]|jgi:DNA-binding MarR family transcriptional regulator|uniref:MarR family transcriptional regulator n=1 Tax=Clostridium disporicum TaxID=84024 RepID=A0A174ABF2_9CLOT|nr:MULTISPECIES: MarR family winged helix-turn-helix transcriptional regulator [Clostridium]MBC5625354.1 winged helix-turn-helix transcriptional regulator [Clostridium sp. NSJ-49]MDU6340948.1 MarR family winged helix-turn-helix transcriptional regulator [Clostridium sp.]CUN85523.1 MarR family transcriptional regulator [Clostridium disporicum]
MDTNFKISNILYNMKHIGDLYYDLSSKAAKECNLTKPEADILLFIKNNPEFNTAKDIVKLRGFSKAYVSKAVEPLLDKELITIEIDKEDRRCQHLLLTEKSEPLLDILLKMQREFIDIITDGIDKEDIKTYIKIMDSFYKNSKKR